MINFGSLDNGGNDSSSKLKSFVYVVCGMFVNVVSFIPRKAKLIVHEFRRLEIELAGLSEIRWSGQGKTDVDGCTLFGICRPCGNESLQGVGIMLGGSSKSA